MRRAEKNKIEDREEADRLKFSSFTKLLAQIFQIFFVNEF